MNKLAMVVLAGSFAATGCTSRLVNPVPAGMSIASVCIEPNPKVAVDDFLEIVRAGFERNGISATVHTAPAPASCEYVVTYTARKTWDVTTYLSFAEIYIHRQGQRVALGHYHLRGGGGLAMNKWKSAKSKIDPVIDNMLATNKRGLGTQGKAIAEIKEPPTSAAPVDKMAIRADAP